MVADTEPAAAALVADLHTLEPWAGPARLWETVGVTEMPGTDDYGPDETFSAADRPSACDDY